MSRDKYTCTQPMSTVAQERHAFRPGIPGGVRDRVTRLGPGQRCAGVHYRPMSAGSGVRHPLRVKAIVLSVPLYESVIAGRSQAAVVRLQAAAGSMSAAIETTDIHERMMSLRSSDTAPHGDHVLPPAHPYHGAAKPRGPWLTGGVQRLVRARGRRASHPVRVRWPQPCSSSVSLRAGQTACREDRDG